MAAQADVVSFGFGPVGQSSRGVAHLVSHSCRQRGVWLSPAGALV